MLANTGVALDDSLATRSSLLSTLLRSPAALGVLSGDAGTTQALALSPDGSTLAAGDGQGQRHPSSTPRGGSKSAISSRRASPGPSPSTPEATRSRSPSSARARHGGVPADRRPKHSASAQRPSLLGPHPAAPDLPYFHHRRLRPRRAKPGGLAIPPATSTPRRPCSCGVSMPAPAPRSDRPSASPRSPTKIPLISTADGRLLVSTATTASTPPTRSTRTRSASYDRYPVSASSTGHQPRRAHARVRVGGGGWPSPARPRLRAVADARLAPHRDSGSGPSAPTDQPCRLGTRRERDPLGPGERPDRRRSSATGRGSAPRLQPRRAYPLHGQRRTPRRSSGTCTASAGSYDRSAPTPSTFPSSLAAQPSPSVPTGVPSRSRGSTAGWT